MNIGLVLRPLRNAAACAAALLLVGCATGQDYDGWGAAPAWEAAVARDAQGVLRPPEAQWGVLSKLVGTRWIQPNDDDAGFQLREFRYDGSGIVYERILGYPVGAAPYIVSLNAYSPKHYSIQGNRILFHAGGGYELSSAGRLVAHWGDGDSQRLYPGNESNMAEATNGVRSATRRQKWNEEAERSDAMGSLYNAMTGTTPQQRALAEERQRFINEGAARTVAERAASGGSTRSNTTPSSSRPPALASASTSASRSGDRSSSAGSSGPKAPRGVTVAGLCWSNEPKDVRMSDIVLIGGYITDGSGKWHTGATLAYPAVRWVDRAEKAFNEFLQQAGYKPNAQCTTRPEASDHDGFYAAVGRSRKDTGWSPPND